jgi:hypothetical protein
MLYPVRDEQFHVLGLIPQRYRHFQNFEVAVETFDLGRVGWLSYTCHSSSRPGALTCRHTTHQGASKTIIKQDPGTQYGDFYAETNASRLPGYYIYNLTTEEAEETTESQPLEPAEPDTSLPRIRKDQVKVFIPPRRFGHLSIGNVI